jgi:CheY-like chemotaxis protein
LTRADYEVIPAADGKEALDQIAEATPDLIVLDVMMPSIELITAVLILAESFLAMFRLDFPGEPVAPYPSATAIISA